MCAVYSDINTCSIVVNLVQLCAGAYTTARTVGGSSIFELRFHIQRLATSARLMLEAEGASNHESVTEDTLLAPKVMSSIQSAVQTYRQFSGDETSELKVTVLLTWNETGASKVSTHISHMGPRPSRPVKAQVRGAPRNNAEAKDSQWVIQRKQLENQKPTDVNEVLLVGEDGSLYEGLSSNFFALMNGTLYTAEEGVLLGSVREAVLRVCAQHNIPVVLQPPNLKDLHLWEAAFVSSTSRLLLQLDEIQVADTEPAVVRKFEQSDVARKLDKWVYEDVLAHSEPIGGQDDE